MFGNLPKTKRKKITNERKCNLIKKGWVAIGSIKPFLWHNTQESEKNKILF